jgi:hypothetical protein
LGCGILGKKAEEEGDDREGKNLFAHVANHFKRVCKNGLNEFCAKISSLGVHGLEAFWNYIGNHLETVVQPILPYHAN